MWPNTIEDYVYFVLDSLPGFSQLLGEEFPEHQRHFGCVRYDLRPRAGLYAGGALQRPRGGSQGPEEAFRGPHSPDHPGYLHGGSVSPLSWLNLVTTHKNKTPKSGDPCR